MSATVSSASNNSHLKNIHFPLYYSLQSKLIRKNVQLSNREVKSGTAIPPDCWLPIPSVALVTWGLSQPPRQRIPGPARGGSAGSRQPRAPPRAALRAGDGAGAATPHLTAHLQSCQPVAKLLLGKDLLITQENDKTCLTAALWDGLFAPFAREEKKKKSSWKLFLKNASQILK